MVRLLVIADDFTGALDTGVQFKAKGTLIRVREQDSRQLFAHLSDDVQVLIVDAETRHVKPEEAYRIVYDIVAEAARIHVACVYKKTDSALRGNVGAELAAALEASGLTQLHFIPAFPKMQRKTVLGIHYIEGVPVADSVFGADAFEPVRCSAVAEIIRSQSTAQIHHILSGTKAGQQKGLLLYDASTDGDMWRIALSLKEQGKLRLLAGCAGFAAMLPELLGLEQREDKAPELPDGLLTVCGSINPITVRQLEAAEEAGVPRIRLKPYQKLTSQWLDGPEGESCLRQWIELLQQKGNLIVECGEALEEDRLDFYEQQFLIKRENMRTQIAATMGKILKRLLDQGVESTVLVTGGDTLLAFIKQIRVSELTDICEILPGTVLTRVRYDGRSLALISKSGGFGDAGLLTDLLRLVGRREERACVV